MRNPPPPPSQNPKVIKEGDQPIKPPTWESVQQKTEISKNYRIAEKDGVFWIEGLKYVKPSSDGEKIKEYWKGKQYDWFNAEDNISMFKRKTYPTLEEAKRNLDIIIETIICIENTKQSNETKYHYLNHAKVNTKRINEN